MYGALQLIKFYVRYDSQHRGVKPYFGAWRYFTELNNVHYQLLALETRRNDRSRFIMRDALHAVDFGGGRFCGYPCSFWR